MDVVGVGFETDKVNESSLVEALTTANKTDRPPRRHLYTRQADASRKRAGGARARGHQSSRAVAAGVDSAY